MFDILLMVLSALLYFGAYKFWGHQPKKPPELSKPVDDPKPVSVFDLEE